VIALDTNNCLARCDGVHIAMVGVDDFDLVTSGKDVLVLPRGHSQDVNVLLEALRAPE
jgi:mannose-1-phosphate guanylyltransferase